MVKIKKEDFEKLSQLDRIEFRQIYEKGEVSFDVMDYAYYVIIIGTILIVGGFIETAAKFFSIAIYIIITQIIMLFVCMYINSNRKKKLVHEYFDIIIKKDKKK